MGYFIHEKAIVETTKIGDNTRIWAFVHILPKAIIGKNVNICDFCFVENEVVIGDNVTIKSGVHLWDGINIEDSVFIGPSAVFTNDRLPRSKNTEFDKQKTILKKGCSVGANTTILPGITIGEYSMVGAGSVVTKDIPNFAVYFGNPARQHGYICICSNTFNLTKNESSYQCKCDRKYVLKNNSLIII